MNLFSPKKNYDENHVLESVPEDKVVAEVHNENPLVEILRFSVIALLIVIPIRMFIAQPFIVSGSSMVETFHNGEYLIVDQLSYQLESPARGDVIIFRYPRDPSKFFIKRVIAMPNEIITIENSTVTIVNEEHPEGFVLEEPYINSMRAGTFMTEDLGDREYFVMGDNRDESSDSRVWGVLQEERIIGRAFLRLFPPNSISVLPGTFSQSEVN